MTSFVLLWCRSLVLFSGCLLVVFSLHPGYQARKWSCIAGRISFLVLLWRRHLGAADIYSWAFRPFRYLYKYIHKHTCISYLPPLVQDLTQWPAQTCCSSYPQTLCFPNVEEMTPCTHKAESWLNTTHQKQPVTRCGIAWHSWRFLKKGGTPKSDG